MLPKRKKREPMGLRVSEVVRCAGHLQWVRGCVCIINDIACGGRTQAAHVRLGTDGGTAMKPGDNWTNPMCESHHDYQHRIGEPPFQKQYNVDLKTSAAKHWEISPAGKRYRLKHTQP